MAIDVSQECDMVFWTFSADRPNGHVGALLKATLQERVVTHASSRHGVIAEPLDNFPAKSLSGLRRLTIGD